MKSRWQTETKNAPLQERIDRAEASAITARLLHEIYGNDYTRLSMERTEKRLNYLAHKIS